MTAAPTARDRILDALQRILIAKGPGVVTLDAVAAEAGVSKGGLLYHFSSKQALFEGLLRRLQETTDAEIEQARKAEGGVARFYLETSSPCEEEASLYWAVIAALRGAEFGEDISSGLLREAFVRWGELLREHIADPVLAETVRLVGDGLYLSEIAGLPRPDPALVRRVIDRLLAEVDAAAARE